MALSEELGSEISTKLKEELQMNVTSITKAKKILQHQLDILWDNPEKAEMVPPLMIWGPPGIGKSTFIRNLCKENEIGFIDVRFCLLYTSPSPRDS